MSAEPAEKRIWTAPEYLTWERAQPTKHEFFQGEIFAMPGATREHNLLVLNIGAELRNALRKKPCEVYPSDMRTKVPATGLYTQPDAIVVCGKPEFEDGVHDTLLNPKVLVEVLSDSSESYDRGKKFEQYRSIDGLAEYVLVAQDRVFVDHFNRQPDGSWSLREARAGGRITLPSIDCTIEVDEVYLKVFSQRRLREVFASARPLYASSSSSPSSRPCTEKLTASKGSARTRSVPSADCTSR